MARNRKKTDSLTYQIQNVFDEKLAIGESKCLDKRNNGTQNKIYCWNTYIAYMKHSNYFAKWAKETHGSRTLAECRPHVDAFLIKRKEDGMSPYTQKLEASALAKMYSCSTKEFVKTEVRHRANITRSRGVKDRDKFFSEEKNKVIVDFCKSTGLRRRELKALTGDKLKFINDEPYIIINIGAKGGRYREVPIIDNKQNIIDQMKLAGEDHVFKKVPVGADVHSYRSDYATAFYHSIARKIEDIPYDKINAGTNRAYQSEVYHCRGDLKGVKYDKKAMLLVSEALGHNREEIIAGHYIKA